MVGKERKGKNAVLSDKPGGALADTLNNFDLRFDEHDFKNEQLVFRDDTRAPENRELRRGEVT